MRVECDKCKHRFDIPHRRVLEEAGALKTGRRARMTRAQADKLRKLAAGCALSTAAKILATIPKEVQDG